MDLTEKTVLLADVGGTNTRVAVVCDGRPAQVQHFENGAFSNLYDLLEAFVHKLGLGRVDGCSIAMAGPVRAGQGRLTNRDWHISTAGLAQAFTGARAVLLNDLSALGYALGSLPDQSLSVLDAPTGQTPNGQSLVVGIGTGFNLCPVWQRPDGSMGCLEVEMGHAALPAPLRDHLARHIGQQANRFTTLEDLFSGQGLAGVHHARTKRDQSAKRIVDAHTAGDAQAGETLEIYTALLGSLCRELTYQYMPMNGIYFAGSVARGVLRPEFHANVMGNDTSGKLGNLTEGVPKTIILDDAAALTGCLAAFDMARPA